jgi:hypothetical protein
LAHRPKPVRSRRSAAIIGGSQIEHVRRYIAEQEQHHRKLSFQHEFWLSSPPICATLHAMLGLEQLAELLETNRVAAKAHVKEFSVGGQHCDSKGLG